MEWRSGPSSTLPERSTKIEACIFWALRIVWRVDDDGRLKEVKEEVEELKMEIKKVEEEMERAETDRELEERVLREASEREM
ncbi:hypothetical protein HK102_009198, partial [Quaeritorhiza haematococci]